MSARRGLVLLASLVVLAGGVRPAAAADPEQFNPLTRSRLHLANELERERRFEEALDLYQELYATAPEDPAVLRGLKATLLELKQYPELTAILDRQLAATPDDPALLVERGTTAARMGERDMAYATWRRILEVQEGSRGAYATVADLLKRNRMLDEALEVYREADRLHPGRFTRQEAELYEMRFDFESATRTYLDFLESNPTALSYVEGQLLEIGEAEEGLGPVLARVEARIAARPANPRGPGAQDLVFRKLVGDLYLEAGDHERAAEHYFQLADGNDGQFSSLLVFGKRCQADGEHAAAIRVFERIVEQFRDARITPSALSEIAYSQAALGRNEEALDTYSRLIGDYPETDWALSARMESGRILRDGLARPDSAEAIFRELISRGSGPWGEAVPQLEVAECALWRGDLEMAGGIYRSVRERPFSDATKERALFEEARVRFHEGTFALSDSLFKAVAENYPTGLHVNDALEFSILINTNRGEEDAMKRYASALLDLRKNDPDRSVGGLEELVAAYPGDPLVDESLLLLGEAQRAAGRPQQALDALMRAVAQAQVMDLAADARLLRARIFAEDLGDRASAMKEYEELLVAYPETLAADRARELAGELKRVLP